MWQQAAVWAWHEHMDKADTTIVSVRQLDKDTIEIMKRLGDKKPGLMQRMWGTDEKGLFQRVTINRRTGTVDIDRMDNNFWAQSPFVGMRDHFYIEDRGGSNSHNGQLTFVRHWSWYPTLFKFGAQLRSRYTAYSYNRAFASTSQV